MTAGRSASGPAPYGYALSLVAVAGAVDAIGFLHVRAFYVSFMSGNTTRVAVALQEGDFGLAARGSAIIGGFVAGVVAGDLLMGSELQRSSATLGLEAVLLVLAAVVAATAGAELMSSLILTLCMGIHNALLRRAAGIGMALTYVTGTLVHFGQGIAARLARRPNRPPVWPYAGRWTALFVGAVLGGMAAGRSASLPLVVLAGIMAALALATPRTDIPEGEAT